jgi:hypothetical protein
MRWILTKDTKDPEGSQHCKPASVEGPTKDYNYQIKDEPRVSDKYWAQVKELHVHKLNG